MAPGEEQAYQSELPPQSDDVLGSWKEIAQYLGRDVRTVMRWERTRGMPVHRLPGSVKAPVHALKSELEAWRAGPAGADPDAPPPDADATGPSSHPASFVARFAARRRILGLGATVILVAGLLALAVLTRGSRTATRRPLPPIRSLAVLPFASLNKDASQDYLADGVQEILITELARSSGVRVTARTSVARYAGTRQPVRDIARELGVDALVEGSVLRAGGRVLISAQLVRGDTEDHVWADKYDRDVGDILRVLDQVATAITGEIRTAVKAKDAGLAAPASLPRAVRPEALDLYVRGRYAYHSMAPEGIAAGLGLYRKALALDPAFALAWCGISAARTTQAFFGILPPDATLPEARDAANRALALDARSGEAYGHLGYIALYFDRDFQKAREALELAVSLSPNNLMVRHEYADYLLVKGQVQESLEQVQLGRENDPLSWPAHGIVLYHSLMAGRYDKVRAEGQTMLQALPNNPAALEWTARAAWLTGHADDALRLMRTVYRLDDGAWARVERAHRARGARAAMLELARWVAAREPKNLQAGAFTTALLYGAAGDVDQALRWLEVSDERREPFLLHAGADPFLAPVRPDPRFQAFLQRLGIRGVTP